jgi:phage terminase small subunit
MEAMQDKTIASAEEVIQYLSSVVRGQSQSSVLSMCGDGCQEVIQKAPDEKERLKAAELLGKRYGLYSDKVNIDGAVPIIFAGEDGLED